MRSFFPMTYRLIRCLTGIGFLLFVSQPARAQKKGMRQKKAISVSRFHDSAHHWKDITDHHQVIGRLQDQHRYNASQVRQIADNILLYQLANGGWPKNYDMLAVLTEDQKNKLQNGKHILEATFDNGATHSQIAYLARANYKLHDSRYRKAIDQGLDYILEAQYENGGWPQFYPDTSGYRKYITFNDGAMTGIMKVLHDIVQNSPYYSFLDKERRQKVQKAFWKGIDCILKMQIKEQGKLTGWCQQHDNKTLKPRGARTFELASKASQESAQIVELLMSIDRPNEDVVRAVNSAVRWFRVSAIHGIRIKTVDAEDATYEFHSTSSDKVVVKDATAPPVWARFYELKTNRPLFANRDGKKVYKLSDVARERRTGYGWYGDWPRKLLEREYPEWRKKLNYQNSDSQ